MSVSNYQNSCHKLFRLDIKTKMAQCDLPSWLFTSSKWAWISLTWMIFNLNGFPAKIIPKWRQITTRFLFILYHRFIVLTYSVICCYVDRIIESIWRAQVFFPSWFDFDNCYCTLCISYDFGTFFSRCKVSKLVYVRINNINLSIQTSTILVLNISKYLKGS